MNLVNFMNAKLYTKKLTFLQFCLFSILLIFFSFDSLAWEIDFSKRQIEFNQVTDQTRAPASIKKPEPTPLLIQKTAQSLMEPVQEIAILNTSNGFIPNILRLKKDTSYKINIVNVHSEQKNLSFVMDAFSESKGTHFGEVNSFTVSPKIEGVFSYLCPETAAEGRIVVIGASER
ncbi:MAG TPA: cupredoxin domain-containing protein [Pseudobdellovibrionaceae bacterium]|nr:cupredoxin domain-containing protein [Pseudobdellovibrionaceae bacterium]